MPNSGAPADGFFVLMPNGSGGVGGAYSETVKLAAPLQPNATSFTINKNTHIQNGHAMLAGPNFASGTGR